MKPIHESIDRLLKFRREKLTKYNKGKVTPSVRVESHAVSKDEDCFLFI